MTKLEELKAALDTAADAWVAVDAEYAAHDAAAPAAARDASDAAWADWAALEELRAAAWAVHSQDAFADYQAKLKKRNKENSND
jgi:hypothetical protein